MDSLRKSGLPHPDSSGDLASPESNIEALLVACYPLMTLTMPYALSHGLRNELIEEATLSHHQKSSRQLVEAFVAICNHKVERRSPTYCAALTVTAERACLYYASDRKVSQDVIEHVEACLAILRNISMISRDKFGQSSPNFEQRCDDEDIRPAEDELVMRVYRFCYPYLRRCFMKQGRFENLVKLFETLKTEGRLDSSLEAVDMFCKRLWIVYGLLDKAADHSQLSDQELRNIHRSLRVVSGSAKEKLIKNVLEGRTVAIGVLGSRFIDKICGLGRSISSLIHFAVSARTRHIVENFPDPIWIQPPPPSEFRAFLSSEILDQWSKSLNCPLESPPSLLHRVAESNLAPGMTQDGDGLYYKANDSCNVHSECALINYILENNLDVYSFLASSKLSCYMCKMYMRAVNKVFGKEFTLRSSCNFRLVLPWIYPANGGVGDEVKATMASDVFHDLATVWNARYAAYLSSQNRLDDSDPEAF